MKREKIIKTMIILILGAVLLVRPVNVFATVDATDLNNYINDFEDQGSKADLEEETTEEESEEINLEGIENEEEVEETTKEETEELPHAGVAEDTMMVVAIVVLGSAAIFTFKKVNEYSNI